jgi:hypothetical protein
LPVVNAAKNNMEATKQAARVCEMNLNANEKKKKQGNGNGNENENENENENGDTTRE